MFCNQALKTLSLQIPESLKVPEDFEQVKADFLNQQREEFETGIRV
ncbi:MAG: hypothetical protein LBI53_06525 [Candidatus Peribacteria bacterium]|jgi:hypothetical protein|nr:hypothetical protein [Candidatus Peribacteria bacterium]